MTVLPKRTELEAQKPPRGLVTDDKCCHCGAGSRARSNRDAGGVRSKHGGLVATEGALARYVHHGRRGVRFKSAVAVSYVGIPDRHKLIAALRVGGYTQSRIDDTS